MQTKTAQPPIYGELRVARDADRCGVSVEVFVEGLPSLLATSDVVVSMGGYNTMCEVLAVASNGDGKKAEAA